MARLVRALDRSYCDLGNHLPQDLSPQEKTKIQKLLKKLTRDPSDQQLLSPKQLHALRVALDDFQPSDQNITLLNILKTGETTDHFSDEEKKEALRAYLSAIEVIKEIRDPTDIRLYYLSIFLRLGYVTSGFCTIVSSIRNVSDKFGLDKNSYPNIAAQFIAGFFNGIANFAFTGGQLLELLKVILPEIKNSAIDYRTARGVCYGFAGLIAILPSVVQMLHTEKTFPLPMRCFVATVISGTLLPMYSKDGIEFYNNMVKPAYERLEEVGLMGSCEEIFNYAKQHKSKILFLISAYTLGAFHTSNYIRGGLDYLKPSNPAEIAIKAVAGVARIPFITVVSDNFIKAIKHRSRSDHCSSKSFFVACCIVVSCLSSSLVTFAQCNLDLGATSFFLLTAAAIFGFLKSIKNFLTTNQVPLNSFNKLFREPEQSDVIELGNVRTNSPKQEATHFTNQITRHLSLDLPRREQPKSSPRQPHEAGLERRHSAGL